MTPFRRQPPSEAWMASEAKWRTKGADLRASDALHGWQSNGEPLGRLFHRTVRCEGDPLLCAYCDGDLRLTSSETIDHFLPESRCRKLSLFEAVLSWWNLFPACDECNSKQKRDKWSCLLLRPDTDPVDRYFASRPRTGELYPAPEGSRLSQARVRKTIHILGLNTERRCLARRRLLEDLQRAQKLGDHDRLRESAEHGPYRFVVRHFLATFASASTLQSNDIT